MRRINNQIVLCVLFFVTLMVFLPEDVKKIVMRARSEMKKNVKLINPVFVMALCDGEKESTDAYNVAKRQIHQATVLVKSAALLTSSVLSFIILVDTDYLFDDLMKEMQDWPVYLLQKLRFEKRKVCFSEKKNFRPLFRICSTARLFVPRCIPDVDSVIYLDTDIIFMKPPEYLWYEFQNFNEVQLTGMAPALNHYTPKLKIPYYGETGLNAGVWLMNLTRFRTFSGGWENSVLEAFQKYEKHIKVGDQDIANIIFHKYPKYLYELSCSWNYRSFLCDNGVNLCPEAEPKGVYLVHGNAMEFYSVEHKKIKVMYHVWKNFEIGRPLKDLLESLSIALESVDGNERKSKCSQVKKIDQILTKSLQNHIDSLSYKMS